MIQKEKLRFLSSYTVASQLMLGSVVIGVINIFLHGLGDLADTLLALGILVLRYLSFVMLKRRFSWSRYLLLILFARSIYRLVQVAQLPDTGNFYLAMVGLQLILTLSALYLVYFPRKLS